MQPSRLLSPLGRSLGLALGLSFGLLLSACASSPAPGAAPRGPSLSGAGPWTVAFVDDACALSGTGATASLAKCDLLGELTLEGDLASSMGQKVAALTVRQEETAGGAVATLSTSTAMYQLEPSQWGPLVQELRATLTAARIAEREARFAGARSCPAPQVVLSYDECPGDGTVADVCGPATVSCGAPLAAGAACLHNGACASQKCGWLSAVCEG